MSSVVAHGGRRLSIHPASDLWSILFCNASEKGTLPYWHLCLSGMVSRGFKASVREALRLLRTLSFNGAHARQCTGEDVLRALGRAQLLSGQAWVREERPGLKRINLAGRPQSCVRSPCARRRCLARAPRVNCMLPSRVRATASSVLFPPT